MAAKDLWKLTRPGIVAMVLFSMAVAAWTAGEQPPPWAALLHCLLGTGLVIVGAVTLNQRLEFRGDARMARTAARPLPAGRLTQREVALVGLGASAAGAVYLAALGQFTLLALAALSWVLYVWTYTPLKRRTAWQTPVGAAAGAMPMLLGAAVADAPTSVTALALFGVVFCWQLPHAMAIAWLYRHQFASAQVRLASVVDPSGRLAALVSAAGAAVLLPVSLAPYFHAVAGWQYAATAAAIGGIYLGLALLFLYDRTDRHARWLLRASLVYLPALLAALAVAVRGG